MSEDFQTLYIVAYWKFAGHIYIHTGCIRDIYIYIPDVSGTYMYIRTEEFQGVYNSNWNLSGYLYIIVGNYSTFIYTGLKMLEFIYPVEYLQDIYDTLKM